MLDKEKQELEISEEELNEVAGGGIYSKDGFLKTTAWYRCPHFTCKSCGRVGKHEHTAGIAVENCCDCSWHKPLRCNNPINKR